MVLARRSVPPSLVPAALGQGTQALKLLASAVWLDAPRGFLVNYQPAQPKVCIASRRAPKKSTPRTFRLVQHEVPLFTGIRGGNYLTALLWVNSLSNATINTKRRVLLVKEDSRKILWCQRYPYS